MGQEIICFNSPTFLYFSFLSIEYEIFIEDLQASIDGEREDYFRPQQMDLASYSYNVYHTFDEVSGEQTINSTIF